MTVGATPSPIDDLLGDVQVIVVQLGAGGVLFRAGRVGDGAFVVRMGLMLLEMPDSAGNEVVRRVYRPGDVLAAARLLAPGSTHDGTARALVASQLQVLTWDDLDQAGVLRDVRRRLGHVGAAWQPTSSPGPPLAGH